MKNIIASIRKHIEYVYAAFVFTGALAICASAIMSTMEQFTETQILSVFSAGLVAMLVIPMTMMILIKEEK